VFLVPTAFVYVSRLHVLKIAVFWGLTTKQCGFIKLLGIPAFSIPCSWVQRLAYKIWLTCRSRCRRCRLCCDCSAVVTWTSISQALTACMVLQHIQ